MTRKKKVIVITTGGTIGSILQADSISNDLSNQRISQEIEKAKKKLGFLLEVRSPINKNSEELTPSDWGKILGSLKDANESDADGIVVTHGTDTMVYSVAVAICYYDLWKKKICFTGSYYSPDHPSSDTSLSLLSSLEFVATDHPASGIYVAFRSNSNNSEAQIMDGCSIKPMTFDNEYFESVYGKFVAKYTPKDGISSDISFSHIKRPTLGVSELPISEKIKKASRRIACVTLYPGIDKDYLFNVSSGRDILIIQAYHSGTGPSDDENRDLLDFIKTHKITVLMGTVPTEYFGLPYKSTERLNAAGAHIYFNLQQHFLYVFSLLGLSVGMTTNDIVKRLQEWEL